MLLSTYLLKHDNPTHEYENNYIIKLKLSKNVYFYYNLCVINTQRENSILFTYKNKYLIHYK